MMQHPFWCGACGFVIQACTHRIIEVVPWR
jgi:hypothetical protein